MTPEQSGSGSLAGLKVLIVEDETLIAMLLEDMISDLGGQVVGPASSLPKALEIAQNLGVALDAAILDVNLGGADVSPVAEALAGRQVPFAFATGYGAAGPQGPWRERPTLQKPYTQEQVAQILQAALKFDGGAQ